MPCLSTPLTLAATGGILGSAWISGGIGALSICAIPSILQSGTPTEGLVRAWYTQFTRALYLPAAAVIAATNYLYLAQRHWAAGREWRGYAAACVANLLLVPFTQLFIMGINNTLMASMTSSYGASETLSPAAAAQLIERWGRMNLVRIFMPLTGAVLGLWNLLR